MTSRRGPGLASDESQARQDFRPGHSVHWIQAKKAGEHQHAAEPGRIVDLAPGEVVVDVAGRRRRYAVAKSSDVESLVGRFGSAVLVQEDWSLLRLNQRLVSIRADPL